MSSSASGISAESIDDSEVDEGEWCGVSKGLSVGVMEAEEGVESIVVVLRIVGALRGGNAVAVRAAIVLV